MVNSHQIETGFGSYKSLNPLIQSLNQINKKTRVKSIATYDFPTLYTKLQHDKLKYELSSISDFAFKVGDKTFTRLSNNGVPYWRKKTKE